MEKITTTTVYLEVPVSERLPEIFGMQLCTVKVKDDGITFFPVSYVQFDTIKGDWTNPSISGISCEVISWFEKKENVILFTESELKEWHNKLVGDAFEAGFLNGHSQGADIEKFTNHPDKEQYLSNLLK